MNRVESLSVRAAPAVLVTGPCMHPFVAPSSSHRALLVPSQRRTPRKCPHILGSSSSDLEGRDSESQNIILHLEIQRGCTW